MQALKAALYVALDSALSVPVYDHVPQGSEYPYVSIDTLSANNAEFLNSRKDGVSVYLSVWSTYRGQTEVLGIMQDIDDALHNNRLALASGRLASCRVVSKDTNREPDGVTYQGQVVISVLLEY